MLMILLIAGRDECDLIFSEAITFMLCLAPISSKAGQQLLCKASLFCFVLGFFPFLLFPLNAFSLHYFSHRSSEEQARKQQADLPLLLLTKFKISDKRFFIAQSCTENTKATHTLPDAKTFIQTGH